MDRKVVIAGLTETRALVLEQFGAAPRELEKSYGPGKWTVKQILAHLADAELVFLWRLVRAACEPGANVEAYDQDRLAAGLSYATRPLAFEQDLFQSTRQLLIHYVEKLPEQSLLQECVHPERGRVMAIRWAERAIDHTAHHLTQIEAARAGVPWKAADRAGSGQYTGRQSQR